MKKEEGIFFTRQKVTIGIIVIATLFVFLAGTYSFFMSPTENNKNQEVSLETGNLALTFSDGDNGINKEIDFGETVTKKFTIENTGTVAASLSIDWFNLVNTYKLGSLTYNLTYQTSLDGEKLEVQPETNIPTSSEALTQTLISEVSVPAGKTYYYNLNITLNNTAEDQTNDLNAIFTTQFNVGQTSKYRYYTLSVNPNGGTWNEFTSTQEYKLQFSETLDIPNPTKTGYTFSGWTLEGTASSIDGTTFTMGLTDTILLANYTPNKYTVTITDAEGNTSTEEVEYGSSIELPSNPTKEGYTFTGYDVTGGSLEGNTLTITDPSNITVTPTFVINQYKYIVYHHQMNIDGEGYTLVDADTDEGEADYNSIVTPGTKPYTGFTAPEVKSLTIKAETTYPPVLNKIDYNYSRDKHNLSINLDGGTSSITGGEMYYESTKDLGTPTKTGYNFTNWTSTSGTIDGNTFKMGTSDSTVTANYTPKTFTVTYNANGGTPTTQSKTVAYDSKYILPDTEPTLSGYTFLGWFTASSGGTQVTTSTDVKITDNQTLFAHWEQTTGVATLLAKVNSASITDYNSGNKGEMFTFSHPATTQTEALTDYRYIGANPNNYITFNNETWRIIGVFTVESSSGTKEQRIKIIRNEYFGDISWASNNVNEWSTATLSTLLNTGDYYNRSGSYASTGLTTTAKSQISPAKWYLGGSPTYSGLGGSDYYNFERGTTVYTGRSTNVLANVGLMYPSDYVYTYANGVSNRCYTDGYDCAKGGPYNGWLFNTDYQWTIAPSSSDSTNAFYVGGEGYLYINTVYHSGDPYKNGGFRPVVYLRSDIQITGGDGTSGNPYTLSS